MRLPYNGCSAQCGIRCCRASAPLAELELAKLLIAQKKERNRSDRANRVHDRGIADEVRKDHQRETAEHQLPEIHSFAVNESDKANGAEKQIADEVRRAQAEHVDLNS
jgi:hypothetical protein